jgi:signal transduction histidine kinase
MFIRELSHGIGHSRIRRRLRWQLCEHAFLYARSTLGGAGVRLRTYLQGLTLAAMLPLAAFAVTVVVLTVERERESMSQAAQARALTLITAVEAEMRAHTTTIEALAAMPSLAEDRFDRFREIATAVLESQLDWINIDLALPDGREVINLRLPPGAPLAPIQETPERLARLLRERTSVVGDLQMDPLLKRWAYTVRTPVIRDGRVRYILTANVSPESMGRIIAAQRFSPGWFAVVLDANARIVARNVDSEKYLGQPASRTLLDALATSQSGWFEGRTVEGAKVYSPFWRSARFGWAISMGIPAGEVTAAASHAAWVLGIGIFAALVLSFLLARYFALRISRPIDELVAVTEAIGKGQPASPQRDTPVDELRTLAETLRTAGAAVRERQEALRSADRAKDQFLAVLGHELRNPLAALTAAAHVLKVAPAGETALKARAVLERQTRQMTRLIEDLLDISRISMGKALLDKSVLDLAKVAEEVVSAARQSSANPISLSLPSSAVLVDADRARLEQILQNLIGNAQKFSRPGEPIAIELRAERRTAVLRVSDHGSGIAPAEIDRIFELFVQGEHGPDRVKSGLGLGLALVRRLVEMHGGTVSAASPGQGRGSTFTVCLPLARAAEAPVVREESTAAGEHRILIVDDNADVRTTLREMLSLDGHEVHEAGDGATGIAIARAHAPDVALIDIALPDVDGYEVARRLRSGEHGMRMKLIAVTGFGQPEDERRALEAGFDAHLTKPVRLAQLARAIAGAP